MMKRHYENPPTAGLPLTWRDWLPAKQPLATVASEFLQLPEVEITCSATAALVITLSCLAQYQPQRKTAIIPAYTCPLVADDQAACSKSSNHSYRRCSTGNGCRCRSLR